MPISNTHSASFLDSNGPARALSHVGFCTRLLGASLLAMVTAGCGSTPEPPPGPEEVPNALPSATDFGMSTSEAEARVGSRGHAQETLASGRERWTYCTEACGPGQRCVSNTPGCVPYSLTFTEGRLSAVDEWKRLEGGFRNEVSIAIACTMRFAFTYEGRPSDNALAGGTLLPGQQSGGGVWVWPGSLVTLSARCADYRNPEADVAEAQREVTLSTAVDWRLAYRVVGGVASLTE